MISARLVAASICFMLAVSGCAPKLRETVRSKALSPSGWMQATVVERQGEVLAPASFLVFVHPASERPDAGEAVLAVTDGSAPAVTFLDDTKLQVRLFGGSKHNQKQAALGVSILYE